LKNTGAYTAVPASYGLTLIVFGQVYFFAREWSGGSVVQFFAKVSFPLYACHAALGYTGMAYINVSRAKKTARRRLFELGI
jgi:hypothetical protein